MIRLLLLTVVLATTPAVAEPALFVAHARGVTLTLFGSLDALPPGHTWRTPALDRAFDAADEYWFEHVFAEIGPQLPGLLKKYGTDPDERFVRDLTPPQADELRQAVEDVHVPGGMAYVRTLRPWLAKTLLTSALLERTGVDLALNVDGDLQQRAAAHHKPLHGLETIEQRFARLAATPDSTDANALLANIEAAPTLRARYDAMLQAWITGDAAAAADQAARLEGNAPDLFRTANTLRSTAWAKRLTALIGTNKTVFVTVDAAHLAGDDALLDSLAQAGFTIQRMDPPP